MSQNCFVPLTPIWLCAKALNSSVTQHVVCRCLEVHKTSKVIVRGLHISKTETIQSVLMFSYLQVSKKCEEIKVASDFFLALNFIR